MELYNKKYVYFEWDERLRGKKGFVATDILNIKEQVNKGTNITEIYYSSDNTKPFSPMNYDCYCSFAYYDPNYEVKKAFNEGKKIQWKYRDEKQWYDWDGDLFPTFFDDNTGYELRVKPLNKELEKENTELKEKLTKAKEIMNDLLFFLNKFYSEDCPVCMDEAEQFLKEEKNNG